MVIKCKMCGGQLNILGEEKVIDCEYCGSVQTLPNFDSEKKTNLFNRANNLRFNKEFDKAAGIYESIVAEFPEESEAYWGLCLCKFGIEYVDDPKTRKKIPTCHRTCTTSILSDNDFELAYENADVLAKQVYRSEAKEIDGLQKRILEVASQEEPYDIFICYKETDEISHNRTEDSLIAQDIYTELIKEGYRVFFSRVTLREKAGTEYEPYIYSALSSAKVMLAIGTRFEYYDAVWVKNEWARFLDMMKQSPNKFIIPCYKDIDAYDIPKEFVNMQALSMGDVTFFKNLQENITRLLPKKHAKFPINSVAQSNETHLVTSLLRRAYLFLEDAEWTSADEYAEKILDVEPENAEAYLIKLLALEQIKRKELLANVTTRFDNNKFYKKVVRFADEPLKTELQAYLSQIQERINKNSYSNAHNMLKKAKTIDDFQKVYYMFKELSGYQDSDDMAERCSDTILQMREKRQQEATARENECTYFQACEALKLNKIADLQWAINEFLSLGEYKDAKEKHLICQKRLENEYERIYTAAIKRAGNETNVTDLRAAEDIMRQILEYKDAKEKMIHYSNVTKALSDKALLIYKRKQSGLCQHCGSEFGGLFKNKCAGCGKKKDY